MSRELIYSKYSNERSRKFAIRTDIYEEDTRRFIKKIALYPEGREHLKHVADVSAVLNQYYEPEGYVCNVCRKVSDGIELEYIKAETLEEKLDSLIAAGDVMQAQNEFLSFLDSIYRIHDVQDFTVTEEFKKIFGDVKLPGNLRCLPVSNIDLICQNVMLSEPKCFIDYEWTFNCPVPREYILYRAIFFFTRPDVGLSPMDVDAVYERYGITEELREIFWEMEQSFQSYSTHDYVPTWDMFDDITLGRIPFNPEPVQFLQVYFGDDTGYLEENSIRVPIRDNEIDFHCPIPEGTSLLRIDPGDLAVTVRICSAAVDDRKLAMECYPSNGICVDQEYFVFPTEDPWFVGIRVAPEEKWLHMNLKVKLINQDNISVTESMQKQRAELERKNAELEHRNALLAAKVEEQKNLIHAMEETKVWKMYRKIKKN